MKDLVPQFGENTRLAISQRRRQQGVEFRLVGDSRRPAVADQKGVDAIPTIALKPRISDAVQQFTIFQTGLNISRAETGEPADLLQRRQNIIGRGPARLLAV